MKLFLQLLLAPNPDSLNIAPRENLAEIHVLSSSKRKIITLNQIRDLGKKKNDCCFKKMKFLLKKSLEKCENRTKICKKLLILE